MIWRNRPDGLSLKNWQAIKHLYSSGKDWVGGADSDNEGQILERANNQAMWQAPGVIQGVYKKSLSAVLIFFISYSESKLLKSVKYNREGSYLKSSIFSNFQYIYLGYKAEHNFKVFQTHSTNNLQHCYRQYLYLHFCFSYVSRLLTIQISSEVLVF